MLEEAQKNKARTCQVNLSHRICNRFKVLLSCSLSAWQCQGCIAGNSDILHPNCNGLLMKDLLQRKGSTDALWTQLDTASGQPQSGKGSKL